MGYHRYWLAEHHGRYTFADASPEVLLARLSAETTSLRLGTGGILLTHYSAFKVAETFSMLEALAPGRIDLGIGRATGSDQQVAQALRNFGPPPDYVAQVDDLLHLIDPRARGRFVVTPAVEEQPEVWLLGSSDFSAALAAELGLPFAYAHFISGDAPEIARMYRARFKPSERRPEPHVMISAAAICTEDEGEIAVFRQALGLWRARLRLAHEPRFPSRDEARTHVPSAREQAHIDDSRRRAVIDKPAVVSERLRALAHDHLADELMIITIAPEYESRIRSYELLAQAFA